MAEAGLLRRAGKEPEGERTFEEYVRGELRQLQAGTYRRKSVASTGMELRLHLERLEAEALARGEEGRIARLAAEVSPDIERLGLPEVYGRELALCFLVEAAGQLQSRYRLGSAESARLAYGRAEGRRARAA